MFALLIGTVVRPDCSSVRWSARSVNRWVAGRPGQTTTVTGRSNGYRTHFDDAVVADVDPVAGSDARGVGGSDDQEGERAGVELVAEDRAETDDRVEAGDQDRGRGGGVADRFEQDAAGRAGAATVRQDEDAAGQAGAGEGVAAIDDLAGGRVETAPKAERARR